MSDIQIPLIFTDAAARKVKSLIEGEENPNLRLRVYITGGAVVDSSMGSPLMIKSMRETLPLRIKALAWWLTR